MKNFALTGHTVMAFIAQVAANSQVKGFLTDPRPGDRLPTTIQELVHLGPRNGILALSKFELSAYGLSEGDTITIEYQDETKITQTPVISSEQYIISELDDFAYQLIKVRNDDPVEKLLP